MRNNKRFLSCGLLLAGLFGALVSLAGQTGPMQSGYFIDRDGKVVEGYFPKGVQPNNLNGFLFTEDPAQKAARVPLDSVREINLGSSEQYLVYEIAEGSVSEFSVLQKLVEGQVNLYSGSSSLKGGTIYLMQEPGDREYLIVKGNFEGALRIIAQRCERVDPTEFSYRQNQLIALAVTYNECLDSPAAILTEPRQAEFRIGLRAYGYFPNLFVPESNYYGLGDYQADGSASVALSLAWVVSRRFQVRTEVSYMQVLSRSDSVNVTPRDIPETYAEVTFNMQYLEIPLLVQYGIPMGRLRPFAEGGLYAGIPLSRALEEDLTYTDFSHIQYIPSVSFSDLNFGYSIGLGIGYALNTRWELNFLARWSQASSLMRTSSSLNGAPNIGFTNLRTDKLSLGLRLEWAL